MRLFLFLLCISFNSFAQLDVGSNTTTDCTEVDFTTPPAPANNIYECRDVVINSLDTSQLAEPSLPLIIKATGSVQIDSLDFRGQPAVLGGGQGGPGGGVGGDSTNPIASNGFPSPRGGLSPAQKPTCATGVAEGSGGGGGSLRAKGTNGSAGTEITGDGVVFPAGESGSVVRFDVNSVLIAGAGGGAGSPACNIGSEILAGSGGGGGGSVRIISVGNISITGQINVSGGDGQSALLNGGGGGGGSAGIIILQTQSQINITTTGSLLALGGAGGTNSTPSSAGDGGAGAPGVIILQDLDGIIPGNISPRPQIIGANKLKSDISCGTIAHKKDNNIFFHLIAGFSLISFIGAGLRTLSRFRLKLS